MFAIYLEINIQNFIIRLDFVCHISQFKILIMPFLSDFGTRKIVSMISRFVVFRCDDNIDFCKITIIRNFSLNPVSDKNFKSI